MLSTSTPSAVARFRSRDSLVTTVQPLAFAVFGHQSVPAVVLMALVAAGQRFKIRRACLVGECGLIEPGLIEDDPVRRSALSQAGEEQKHTISAVGIWDVRRLRQGCMDVPDLQIALIDRCTRCLVGAGEIDEGIDAVVVYDDSSHAR